VLRLLDQSLATELVCVLRCRRHYFMARGIHSQSVAQDFLDQSNEEQAHADQIAERIVIDSYRDTIMYLGDQDPTTRRMLEGILAVEEQHADELADLLVSFPAAADEETP
jgi:bacterioferritin